MEEGVCRVREMVSPKGIVKKLGRESYEENCNAGRIKVFKKKKRQGLKVQVETITLMASTHAKKPLLGCREHGA